MVPPCATMVWLTLLLSAHGAASQRITNIHVCPQRGNDFNSGSVREEPLLTLQAALDKCSQDSGKGDEKHAVIHMHPGTFYLPRTLRFDQNTCSGFSKISLRATSNKATALSAGIRIPNACFKKEQSQLQLPPGTALYTCQLSTANGTAGAIHFDQLFMNGIRVPRARYPVSNAQLR